MLHDHHDPHAGRAVVRLELIFSFFSAQDLYITQIENNADFFGEQFVVDETGELALPEEKQ